MIPDRPTTSSLSLAEWRAAFRARPCVQCGAKIVPGERTTNPATARRITTCSKACKQADCRHRRTPEAIQRDAVTAARRFARWKATGDNYRKHIARTVERRRVGSLLA